MAVSDRKRQQLVKDAQVALQPGEDVEDITTGLMNASRMGGTEKRRGSLIVTDRRLIFFTKKLGGHEVHEFAYHLILSLDGKKGMAFGSIHLHAAGDQIEVNQIDKGELDRVTQSIRAHMGATAPPPTATVAAPSLGDELKKLADLRDRGILTEAEFAAQKAKLLGT